MVVAAVALIAARPVRADDCESETVELRGDADVIAAVAAVLPPGLRIHHPGGAAPTLRISVARDGAVLRLRARHLQGPVAERSVAAIETAAVVIEAWARSLCLPAPATEREPCRDQVAPDPEASVQALDAEVPPPPRPAAARARRERRTAVRAASEMALSGRGTVAFGLRGELDRCRPGGCVSVGVRWTRQDQRRDLPESDDRWMPRDEVIGLLGAAPRPWSIGPFRYAPRATVGAGVVDLDGRADRGVTARVGVGGWGELVAANRVALRLGVEAELDASRFPHDSAPATAWASTGSIRHRVDVQLTALVQLAIGVSL